MGRGVSRTLALHVQSIQGLSKATTSHTASGHVMGHEGTVEVKTLPEDRIIALALQGHQDAFGELVQRYQHAVFNLCYRMLGDYHEAENAAQEVFVKIYRRLPTYKPKYRFSTWVLSIASHHCIDQLRRRRIVQVPLDAPETRRHIHTQTVDPESYVIARENTARLQAKLNMLPEEQRLVLVLHYWYDLSYREIANMLNTTEGAVKTKAHRARRRLGALLQETEDVKGERP